mmetsp:Transcript_15644/g.43143  ORF Transcript_15644/g.43143 Transcript_15644/m.43143 type:complete len:197 (+) Transcript_15644:76-666(+)
MMQLEQRAICLAMIIATAQSASAISGSRAMEECVDFCTGAPDAFFTADFDPVLCGVNTCRQYFTSRQQAASRGWNITSGDDENDCIVCPESFFDSAAAVCDVDADDPVVCGEHKFCEYRNSCFARDAGYDVSTDCESGTSQWSTCQQLAEDCGVCDTTRIFDDDDDDDDGGTSAASNVRDQTALWCMLVLLYAVLI